MMVKNWSEKSAKKLFLYSHEYRDQKMKGKKPAKKFFQKHTNSGSKKYWEKIVSKCAKKRFLYSHEYCDQKNAKKNFWEKIVGIKCDKSFFYIHTNIVFKKGTKNARNNFSRNTRIVRTKNV